MTIKVTLSIGKELSIQQGTSLLDITKMIEQQKYPFVAAAVDNELKDLHYEIYEPAKIRFIDLTTDIGNRIYVRSLSLVFIRAAREVIPNCDVMVEHSLSKGLYCEINGKPLTATLVESIETRMREIIDADEPIEKMEVSREEALEIFKRYGQMDKVKMLKFLSSDKKTIYKLGGVYDFFYGYLVPRTGYLKKFALHFHLPGVIIRFPLISDPDTIPDFEPQPKLAKIFYEAERWAEIMEVNTIADLNEAIVNGTVSKLIKVSEALHEKKVANIADEIKEHKDRGNIILIAGPSSSGKTTFAHRLMIQLMVNGLRPISISVDDYFVNRERTPLDEYGEYDFESIDALDLELLNEHLTRIIQGEEVEIPTFNFKLGRGEFLGHKIKIRPDQPIIIEGIHGLNEKLTYSIPNDHKFKIYISCLTQLNIDNHNRIPTTDIRKLRRLVRDNQFRSFNALDTLRIWPSVRRGEDRNIYPFQEDADIMFNSSLIYELAVLKKYAEPLLLEITKESPAYIEAKRLLRFLTYVLPLDGKEIPMNSIIKEFIG